MIRIIAIIICWGLAPIWAGAQEAPFRAHFGGQVGLAFRWGSPVQRLGLLLRAYHAQAHWQVSGEWRGYLQRRALGHPQARPEAQVTLGLLASYGPRHPNPGPQFHPLHNQSAHRYSLGYAHHWYFDRLTAQRSGTLALQFGAFELLTENDALAGAGKDQYRTGAVQVAWQTSQSRWSLGSILWTGTSHGDRVRRVRDGGTYRCRYGYKDLSEAHCGRFSHGILALGYQRALGWGQNLGFHLGLDSERVRHLLQNLLMHDLPFVPAAWVKVKNPHLPMLDREGEPFLHGAQQELRPTRGYFQVSANASLFY
ncbi:MAG: polymorphic toxin type 23 domain-containing protein [Bacteroidota bacterium]